MKLAIQQSATGAKVLDRAFAIASRGGAEGIGICYPSTESIFEMGRQGYAARLRELSHEHQISIVNLRLACLNLEPALIGKDRDISGGKAIIKMAIWTAVEAGVPMVIVPFFGRNRIEFEHELCRAGKAICELAVTAEENGVVLGLETDIHPERFNRLLFEGAGKYVKAVINTAQLHARRHDLCSMICELGNDRIGQVLVQDAVMVRHEPPEFNVRLGHGDVDIGTVVRSLKARDYDGWVSIAAPPGDDDGQIAAANLAFMRNVLAGMDWLATKLARMYRPARVEELTPA